MKRLRILLTAVLACAAAPALAASVADQAVRADVEGIDLVVLATGVEGVVTLVGTLPAGDDRSPADNAALATLTGAMLDKGTTRRDKFALAQQLGDVGAAIGFGVGPSTLQVSGKCLGKDLPLVVSLLAEQLRLPAFSDAEFAKLKKQYVGLIRKQLEDTDFRAQDAFLRSIYPAGHPNRPASPDEMLAALDRTTLDEVRRFHARYYGPAEMRLVVVGDVDPKLVQAEVRKAFAGWQGGVPMDTAPRAARLAAGATEIVQMPDKTNVSVVIGQPTLLRYADADALALRMATRVLGSGFTGRLMANVRDREGLTYGIGAGVDNDIYVDGDWSISGNFAPNLLAQGLVSTNRELDQWYREGVTAAELERVKTQVAGSYRVGLATTGGMAGTILRMLNAGMPLSFVDDYPKQVAALTLDQVNGAIKRHLDPAKMMRVQAGTVPAASVAK